MKKGNTYLLVQTEYGIFLQEDTLEERPVSIDFLVGKRIKRADKNIHGNIFLELEPEKEEETGYLKKAPILNPIEIKAIPKKKKKVDIPPKKSSDGKEREAFSFGQLSRKDFKNEKK